MTRALVIDDHPVVFQGCRQTISDYGASEVFGALSPLEGFRAYRRLNPDVILLDLSFGPNMFGGFAFIKRFRSRDGRTPILIFSMHDDPVIVRRALALGATGYVQKDASPDTIGEAFDTVRQGKPYLPPDMAARVAFLNRPSGGSDRDRLTDRELEILGLLAAGRSYAEIAEGLSISYKTVANACSSLKVKLAAKTLSDLVAKAVRITGRA